MAETAQNKRVFIKTWGCQMNVYDSDRMTDVLRPLGYETTEAPEQADLVILNTCHIREKAAEKVYSEIGRLRPFKEGRKQAGGGDMMIAVAGCVAQAEGAEIMRRAPAVDLVFGPQTYHRLPEMVARAERGNDDTSGPGRGVIETDFPVEDKFDNLPAEAHAEGVTAFLTVQEGCDKFCTFCVVPYTRGAEFSRPVAQVVEEAKRLTEQGVREITLLGQNVNAYHGEDASGTPRGLGWLIRHLADQVPDLWRIRFTTSHPRDMDDDLIAAHGDVSQLMPYLHLPVQSGSDRTLKAMNRGHGREDYFRLVDRIRDARPDIALSSDFIVGFPGESDRDFQATMDLIERVNYAQAFSFKYSPRPGTPGAAMDLQVEEVAKDERLQALQALLKSQQIGFHENLIGKTLPVLLERPGRHDGQLVGRSPYLSAVHLNAPEGSIGEMVHATVIKATQNSLTAELVNGTE